MFEKIVKILKETPDPNDWYGEGYPSAFMDGDDDALDYLMINIENPDDKKLFEGGEMVENHGGEGEGERYWSVWYFPANNIYIKFFGYYYSYDGATLHDIYEVVPEQVMVTKYKRK